MKVVIDTNTLIGHILWEDSIPNQAVEAAFRQGKILRSRNSLAALENMVLSERFDKYLTKDARETFLALFRDITLHVEITARHPYLDDAAKNILLELAVNGKADFLISSQTEILSQEKYLLGTRCLTPHDFLKAIE